MNSSSAAFKFFFLKAVSCLITFFFFQVSMKSCLPSRKICLSQLTRRDFFLTLLLSTVVLVCKYAKLQSCIKLFLNWPIKMAVYVSYLYFFETTSAYSRALPFWLGLVFNVSNISDVGIIILIAWLTSSVTRYQQQTSWGKKRKFYTALHYGVSNHLPNNLAPLSQQLIGQ